MKMTSTQHVNLERRDAHGAVGLLVFRMDRWVEIDEARNGRAFGTKHVGRGFASNEERDAFVVAFIAAVSA